MSAQVAPPVPPHADTRTHEQLEYGKRSPRLSKKASRPRSGDVSALLRKLRPHKGDGENRGGGAEHSETHSELIFFSRILDNLRGMEVPCSYPEQCHGYAGAL